MTNADNPQRRSLARFFRAVGAILSGMIQKADDQPRISHILYEHYPDGTSRIVGRWTDSRLEIPQSELDERFANAIAQATNSPTLDDRAKFLSSDYIDMRGWRDRQPAPHGTAVSPGAITAG